MIWVSTNRRMNKRCYIRTSQKQKGAKASDNKITQIRGEPIIPVNQPPVFINKVLLKHSCTRHLHIVRDLVTGQPEVFTICSFKKCCRPLTKINAKTLSLPKKKKKKSWYFMVLSL